MTIFRTPRRFASVSVDTPLAGGQRAPGQVMEEENALIARAWQALTDMRDLVGNPPDDLPYLRPSDVGPFLPVDAVRDPSHSLSAEPAESAIHCCLASASALLAITSSLVNRGPYPSEQERVTELKALAELSKTAGRSAYRAALILVDEEPLGDDK